MPQLMTAGAMRAVLAKAALSFGLAGLAAASDGADPVAANQVPRLVAHAGFRPTALAILPPRLPFAVIVDERRATLIDRATGRPLRHADLPDRIRAVVASTDGRALLINTDGTSLLPGEGSHLFKVSTADAEITPLRNDPDVVSIRLTAGPEGWMLLEESTLGPRRNRLCRFVANAGDPSGSMACRSPFEMPSAFMNAVALVPDPAKGRVLAAVEGLFDKQHVVALLQIQLDDQGVREIARQNAAGPLGPRPPVDLVLSGDGNVLHMLTRTLGAGSGHLLQSWTLAEQVARLQAERNLPSQTMLLAGADASGTVSLLRSGYLSSAPVTTQEIDAATLAETCRAMPRTLFRAHRARWPLARTTSAAGS
jgi:hypothetical protein